MIDNKFIKKKIRLGIIGAGEIVRTIHLPVLKQIQSIEIVWIMDINKKRAIQIAQSFGIKNVYSDYSFTHEVDAVLIAVPVGVRSKVWEVVFEKKWNVLCEKPITRGVKEFDEIVKHMLQNKKVLFAGLMRRYYGSTKLAKDIVSSNIFGPLIEIWAGEGGQMTRTARGSDWYQTNRDLAGGGVLIETGSHLIDQLVSIAQPVEVNVTKYIQSPNLVSMEFSSEVSGEFKMFNGEKVPFKSMISRSHEVYNGIFLRFERLSIRIDPGPDGDLQICRIDGTVIAPISASGYGALNSTHAFYLEWLDFINSCNSVESGITSDLYKLTRISIDIIEKCYLSLPE